MRLLYPLTALCLTGTLVSSATADAATFTVSSNGDAGAGTLRQAILDANANNNQPALDEIVFSAATSIVPATQLPAIDEPVTVNGRQAPACTGAPRGVQLDGNNGNYNGLTLAAGSNGSRICALNVRNFGGEGIRVESDGNTIDSSRIGTDFTGEIADGNDTAGIVVTGNGNTIGGTAAKPDAGSGNIISGNADPGIDQTTGLVVSGTGTTIVGNFIGTDDEGDTAIPNEFGVDIGPTATGTTLGGGGPGEGNVISGNTNVGAIVDAGTVRGNFIGLTATGTSALGNGGNGINVSGTVQVGGTTAGEGNVISGNATRGIFLAGPATLRGNLIGPNAAGQAALAVRQPQGIQVQDAGDDAVIGGSTAGAGNVISGNVTAIETVLAVDDLTIQGNTIGLNAARDTALPNDTGIKLGASTTDTQIGGTAEEAGNVISGHTAAAPFGAAVDVGGADGTIVEGNVLGLDADGDVVANDRGVAVGNGGNLTRVGGTAVGAPNVISGNDQGVGLGMGSTNSTVQGNIIGLGEDGLTPKPNVTGVRVEDSDNALIGGTAARAGNVISGNSAAGMFITGDSLAPVVQGNTIGLAEDGSTDVGNEQNGISLGSSVNAQIGGTSAGARNVIAGNDFDGIEIQGGANTGAAIRGNHIGVAADGVTARPNDMAGVEFNTPPGPVTLGGTGAGDGNVIAFNGEDGVRVVGPSAFGAGILGNSIHSNGPTAADDIGIDLRAGVDDGVTPNDDGDADGALDPNHLQNFPVLTSAVTNGSTTTVTGTIDTTPGRSIRIEVFSSASCDPAGHGQGEVLLGATTVTAGTGATPFSAAVGATSAGRQVTATATATDPTANETSEFSACRSATQAPAPPTPPPPEDGTTTTPSTATTPPTTTKPGPTTPKYPAKIRVLRNGIDDGVLDMLIEITARAKTSGAVLSIAYDSSGRTSRFTVPITGTQIKVRKRLPSTQPKDTGITTVTYAGNEIVDPDEVRLRAADGKSKLVRTSSTITGGRLRVEGTVTTRARGVVRIRMSYAKPDGSTGLLDFRAPIDDGEWALNQALPAEAAGGGQMSIQFTGYEPANLRGEQTAKQVP